MDLMRRQTFWIKSIDCISASGRFSWKTWAFMHTIPQYVTMMLVPWYYSCLSFLSTWKYKYIVECLLKTHIGFILVIYQRPFEEKKELIFPRCNFFLHISNNCSIHQIERICHVQKVTNVSVKFAEKRYAIIKPLEFGTPSSINIRIIAHYHFIIGIWCGISMFLAYVPCESMQYWFENRNPSFYLFVFLRTMRMIPSIIQYCLHWTHVTQSYFGLWNNVVCSNIFATTSISSHSRSALIQMYINKRFLFCCNE